MEVDDSENDRSSTPPGVEEWSSLDSDDTAPVSEEETKQNEPCDQVATVIEAGRVYMLMKKEYRISRNMRAAWYFNHLNSIIAPYQKSFTLENLNGELEVISVQPRETQTLPSANVQFRLASSTIVTYMSWKYRLVFAMDLGHSAAAVDNDTGLVFIDKAFQALKNTLHGLTKPFYIPGSSLLFTPELYVTVIAYTPIICCQLHQVLIQGFTLTATNINDFLDQIQHQLEEFENYISTSLADSDPQDSDDDDDHYGIGCLFDDYGRTETPDLTPGVLTPDVGFVNMLRYGLLALQLLPENTSAGIVVITDGLIGLPHMSVLDNLLSQLRTATISCSFIYVGNNCQNNQGLGQVPYIELMQFMATATFGAYLSHAPSVTSLGADVMNCYHKALLTWSFQKGLQHFKIDDFCNMLCDNFLDDHAWRHKSQLLPGGGHQVCDTPLLRNRHAEYTYNASLFSLLSVRLREGYTIKEVTLLKGETQIEVTLVLPWTHEVWIEYVALSAWPFLNTKRTTHVSVYMAGTYEFLHDVTCAQNQFKSPYRTAVVRKFQASVCGLSETDRLLVHLQSFLLSVNNYTIVEGIREKMPLFYLPPQPQTSALGPFHVTPVKVQLTMQQSRRDAAFMAFANYWKPIMLLNTNIWQKWLHAHRIGVLLEHDEPLPKYLHVPNNSGRFNNIQSRTALMVLNTYLKDYSTFVLMENHSYVKFLYDDAEKDKIPTSFFLIRVSSTPPCMVLRFAFMVGTPGYVRNKIVNDVRGEMSRLIMQQRAPKKDEKSRRPSNTAPRDDTMHRPAVQGGRQTVAHRQWSEINCCVLVTKPLEKMLIRYDRKPRDFMSLEMNQPLPVSQGLDNGHGLNDPAASLFNKLTRYQHRQRWVWSVQNGSLMSISMVAVGRILNTLAKIRLQEGYHFAHSSGGVINLVAEMEMMVSQPSGNGKDESTESRSAMDVHNCVLQYILFPPHVATQRQESVSEYDVLDDGVLETTEADSELQIVSECWIEPQYGLVVNSTAERQYLNGLRYPDIPHAMYPIDYECISTLVTFEYLALMCKNSHITCPTNRCSVPQQSVTTPQNPDGCPEVTESAVQYIPYTFNIIGTLAKCQQAELLFSTFLQETGPIKHNARSPRERCSVSSDALNTPNAFLFDLLINKLAEVNDTEVNLSNLECGQFLSHVSGRPRKPSAPNLPFKTPLDLSHNLEAETEQQELEAEKVAPFVASRQVSALSESSSTSFLSQIRASSTMSLSRMVLEKQPLLINESLCSPKSYLPDPDAANTKAVDDVFPRWRCFVRMQTSHRLTLTFMPASYNDLEALMQNCDDDMADQCKTSPSESFELKIRENFLLRRIADPFGMHRSKFWGSSTDTDDDATVEESSLHDVGPQDRTDESVVFEGSNFDVTTSVTDNNFAAHSMGSPDSFSTGLKGPSKLGHTPSGRLLSPSKPAVPKRTLLLPIYCYSASLDQIMEELESLNHDVTADDDAYHDFSFRSEKVRSHRSSMADILLAMGAHEERPDTDSQDDEQEWSFEQHCSTLFDCYYRCFLSGAYRSLQRSFDISRRDFELAIDIVCHELRPVEIDVTKFLETVCGHIREHVEKTNMEVAARKDEYFLARTVDAASSETTVISPTGSACTSDRPPSSCMPATPTIRLPLSVFQSQTGCHDMKALHSLVQHKFASLMKRYFRPVPCAPDYFYYCPAQQRHNSTLDGSQALNETGDHSYAPTTEADESDVGAYYDDDHGAGADNEQSHYESDHDNSLLIDEAYLEQLDADNRNHPLFIQLFCSPALRSRTGILTSIPVNTLPTCLRELPRFREELSEHLSEVDLGELQLTLDIICVTLPSDGEHERLNARVARGRWMSESAHSDVPEAEQDDYMSTVAPSDVGCDDSLHNLNELPATQRDAVTSLVDQIEWMLRDEIVSALHLQQPVTRDTLEMAATHVIDSKEHTNCMHDDIALKFVYGTEMSCVKFVEEFEKMKLPGYHLSKEGDYYYVVLDRQHSPSFLHIESALMERLHESHRFMTSDGNDVISPPNDAPINIADLKTEDVPGISLTRPSPAREARKLLVHSKSEGSFDILDDVIENGGDVTKKAADGSNPLQRLNLRRSSAPDANVDVKDDTLAGDGAQSGFKDEEVTNVNVEPISNVACAVSDVAAATAAILPPIAAKSKLAKLKLTSQSLEKVSSTPTSDSPRSRNSSGDEIRRIFHGAHPVEQGRKFASSPVNPSPDRLRDISEVGGEVLARQARSAGHCAVTVPRRHASGGSQTSSINPSRPQTPRGAASHATDFGGRGSCTDQGYEGDSSDSEGEDRVLSLITSMNYTNHYQPITFWIIMRLHGDHVKIYFHTRPCDDGEAGEFHQHKDLFRQIVGKIQSACKMVNQMLLLESLYDTRMCNFLLVPEADEDVVWKDDVLRPKNATAKEDDSDDDVPHQTAYLSAYQEFKPGHFACQRVWQHKFMLHPRLKTGPGRSSISRGIQALRAVMLEFSVNNRKNMFVVKETSGSVFYLRLHENVAELRTNTTDGGLSVDSRSSSTLSLNVRRTSEADDEYQKNPEETSSVSSRATNKRSGLVPVDECLIISVHGITQPGEEVKVKLIQMLQHKLDEAVLDLISVMLARNPMCKLMHQDVQFIQRPDGPPDVISCWTIPSAALLHLMALRYYIRQNLLQFLHTPKYMENTPETHFQDYSQSSPAELTEHEVFIYNRPHSSGRKGIACIHVCFVDGRGNPVQLLSCAKPKYDAHQDILDPSAFDLMTSSHSYEMAPDDNKPGPTALVHLRVWERGDADMKFVIEKVQQALRHATSDVIMEYKMFTAPICAIPHQQHRMMEPATGNLSAPASPVKVFTGKDKRRTSMFNWNIKPQPPAPKTSADNLTSSSMFGDSGRVFSLNPPPSGKDVQDTVAGMHKINEADDARRSIRDEIWKQTIRRYECGDDGILSNVYGPSLTDWFNFCSNNGVTSINKCHYMIKSRMSVDVILKECQLIINHICADTGLKIFKRVAGKDQTSIYVPHTPSTNNEKPGPSAPGQVNMYVGIARNIRQWRNSIENPFVPDELTVTTTTNPKTHKSCQRFLPFDSAWERSHESTTSLNNVTSEREYVFIPRQWLLVMYLDDRKLTVHTYNWSADMYANLNHGIKTLVNWHNARYDAVRSTVMQKMGLFQHGRFDELASRTETVNPFVKSAACIDILMRHTSPAIRELHTRASALSARSIDQHHHHRSLADWDNILLDCRPVRPMQQTSSLSAIGDPIRQHGLQTIDVHYAHCKECERHKLLNDLYRMWHQKAGRSHIPVDELEFLLSQSELYHYMMAPILFCPKSRQFFRKSSVTTPAPPAVANGTKAEGKPTQRSRHLSGQKEKPAPEKRPPPAPTPVSSPQETRVEESWPNTLIQQYVQYIQSWGFILVHTTAPSSSRRPSRVQSNGQEHFSKASNGKRADQPDSAAGRTVHSKPTSSKVHLQRTIPGGVILVQISLQDVLFCVRLYAYHCRNKCIDVVIDPISGTNSQFQTRRYFYDECEKYKDMIHVNSFAYDFHLRMIQSYIDGRQLVFKTNYHLTGFLRDFIQIYPYPPNHARNFVYSGQISATNQNTSATQLYDYMLNHDKRYEMKAVRMSPYTDKDKDLDSFHFLKEHEYALVCLSHEALQEVASDSQLYVTQKRDDYDVGLVLSLNKRFRTPSGNDVSLDESQTLVLNYYVILTTKREPFPKLQSEKLMTTQQNTTSGVFAARHPLHTIMAHDPLSFLSPSSSPISTNQSQELVNYLGFSSGHQMPLYTLMVRKVQSVRRKIDRMVTNAMSQCRRDLLWHRMLCSCSTDDDNRKKKRSDTDETRERMAQRLTLAEFSELLASVKRRPLNDIDPHLAPLLSQKATWYQGLISVLQAKYPDTSRVYNNADNSQQYVAVLNPNYLDTFLLMSIDYTQNRAELCAIYRETIPAEEVLPQNQPNILVTHLQTHIEGFVNACCYHMWCNLVV